MQFSGSWGEFEEERAKTAFIHESSYIDAPCRIGEHTAIMHFSHVMANTIIGDHCHIGSNVTIASGVLIGNHVRVMNNALLNSGVIMENDVYCGASTVFTEHRHVRANPNNISRISPTLVRQGAKIGANTTIASGHTIGRCVFIEAGSVIDRNIPDFAIVYGNPLKFGGWQCECGHGLRFRNGDSEPACCGYCGKAYLQDSRWKIVQLAEEAIARDSHPQPDPSVRSAQRTD